MLRFKVGTVISFAFYVVYTFQKNVLMVGHAVTHQAIQINHLINGRVKR